ncbi:Glyoxalase-like domain protein [Bacillus sp. THAF10]|uniref:VOC family protein n=1 Tax=Bacillus sp. THAF10 TaxID=2587848 RepID=UPI001268CEF6|nr:glyoxalase [Bacillus sp. THAF10]QFT87962.1 Glyoxalase-like domain protein [Bacillus sp. THAF10]
MEIKGIGGIFYRSRNVDVLKEWYKRVLNLDMQDWGGAVITPKEGNMTIFSLFTEASDYFPNEQQVMLNFQVESIEDSMNHLKQLDIPLIKELEVSEYGKFIWIEDPEGRKIELWEK